MVQPLYQVTMYQSALCGFIIVFLVQICVGNNGYRGWQQRELERLSERVTAFQEAYKRRNPEELYRSFFQPDSVLLPNGGPIRRGKEIIDNYKRVFASGISHLTREPVKRADVTVLTRDIIVEVTAYRLFHLDGSLVDSGKSLIVWKKSRYGEWYMYNTMWNRNS